MEVVLIGKGPGFESAPLKGEGAVTWGVNDACGHRECDVIFWMDRCWEKGNQTDRIIVNSVNLTKTPLYSTQEWDDIPTSKRYPIEELKKFFGVDYFGDSCCYMIALAIWKGYSQISTYGFNYAWGENYVREKPPVEFWLGVALGRGVILNFYGEHCDLLKTDHIRHDPETLYAYGVPQTMERTGIRMTTGTYKRETKEFELSVADRVALIQLLPKTGDYDTLKLTKFLTEALWFKNEDRKKLNLRQVADDDKKLFYIWDDNDIPNVKLEMNEYTQEMIASWLERLNKDKMLGREHFDLYETFCVG